MRKRILSNPPTVINKGLLTCMHYSANFRSDLGIDVLIDLTRPLPVGVDALAVSILFRLTIHA